MKSLTKIAAAVAMAGAFVSPAFADLSPVSPACTLSILNPTYTDCGGSFAGNNNGAQAADTLAYINSEWGPGFVVVGSSDSGADFGPFTSNPGTVTGTLTFDSAIDGPFVLALKASDQFSLFYYNGEGVAISSINYSTAGVALTNQGAPNGLSHATLYSGVPAIPEPETYALMLAGLGAIGFMARRRRQA